MYDQYRYKLLYKHPSTSQQLTLHHQAQYSYELSDEHKQMLDEHSVYYGNYYHRTVPIIIDNIVKTLHRIQAYTEQDEDDEEMEL